MPETTAYLDTLNSEQRRAVEHGVTELGYNTGGPLLVIAGAGSGKTNSLAHLPPHASPLWVQPSSADAFAIERPVHKS